MGFKVASRVRGLSDEAFREAFGAEEQCRSALSRLRWPDGFVCPACGHCGHCVPAGVNGGAKLVHPGGAKLVHLTLCGTRCWGGLSR